MRSRAAPRLSGNRVYANVSNEPSTPTHLMQPCRVQLKSFSSRIISTVFLCPQQQRNNMNSPSSTATHSDQETVLKRPIYLGDLIIGFQCVSPKKTSQTIPQEKLSLSKDVDELTSREEVANSSSDDDKDDDLLTPIVIPKKSLTFYDDRGKKTRVDLKKLAEQENKKLDVGTTNSSLGPAKVFSWEKSSTNGNTSKSFEDCSSNNHALIPVSDSITFSGTLTSEAIFAAEKKRVEKNGGTITPFTQENDRNKELFKLDESKSKLDDVKTEEDKGNLRVKLSLKNALFKLKSKRGNPSSLVNGAGEIDPNSFKTKVLDESIRQDPDKSESKEIRSDSMQKQNEEFFETPENVPVETDRISKTCSQKVPENATVVLEDISVKVFLLRYKHKFCNVCGAGVPSTNQLTSFLELAEKRLKRFVCLTCHERVTPYERARHKSECFLGQEDVYYEGIEKDAKGKLEKFRMLACQNCAAAAKDLS